MRKISNGTWKQRVFYVFIFLGTMILPEPNPVYENLWYKADFYDSIPFTIYYLEYKAIYAAFISIIFWSFTKFAKKHL